MISQAGHNVHAVGVGHKLVNGQPTKTLCVRVYVVSKLPKGLIPPRYLISKEIEGIPTDIIASPPAFLLNTAVKKVARKKKRGTSAKLALAQDVDAIFDAASARGGEPQQQRRRPVMPGVSVGHFMVTAGTIACFCRRRNPGSDDAVFLLSNNHVLADTDRAVPGDDLFQPGPADADELSGTDSDHIADLEQAVPLQFGGVDDNHVDAAIGRLTPATAFEPAIPRIGRITGSSQAEVGLKVAKFGRTTGLTEGVVDDVHYDALVGMSPSEPNIIARFHGQIRVIASQAGQVFGLGGDSGSLVVRKDTNSAVGLYFAGPESGVYGIANPVEDVLNVLQLEII